MGFFDFLFPPQKDGKPRRGGFQLPSLDVRDIKLPAEFLGGVSNQKGDLPNASLVYGVGAAAIGAYGLYSFFTGSWFTALLLLGIAGILFTFALHHLRYPS